MAANSALNFNTNFFRYNQDFSHKNVKIMICRSHHLVYHIVFLFSAKRSVKMVSSLARVNKVVW